MSFFYKGDKIEHKVRRVKGRMCWADVLIPLDHPAVSKPKGKLKCRLSANDDTRTFDVDFSVH